MSAATVVHGFIAFLFLAFACHLLGRHSGRYGFRRGFIERENRARMYTTGALFMLAVFCPQMFPAANRISSDGQIIMLGVVALVFLWSYLRARGVGTWRPFRMTDERHTDPIHRFSVGLPRGWQPVSLTDGDTARNYVFSIGTPDKQAMVSIACRHNVPEPERWKKERLDEFERHRLRFENATPMRAPDFTSTSYPPIGGTTDVLYRRFAAERAGYPKMCTERFIFLHGDAGYVIDHFVTGESDAEIGAILGTWQFEHAQAAG